MTEQPQLEMARDLAGELPKLQVPEGYRLRTYRRGDETAWCRLVNEHIGGDYSPERMRERLLRRPRFDSEDLFFADCDGETVGTACALRTEAEKDREGWVHMVAVDDAHRGRSLGRALVAAVLRRLREVDCESAALHTDDHRLAAIALYLSLGFQPRVTDGSHPARWRAVRRRLKSTTEARR